MFPKAFPIEQMSNASNRIELRRSVTPKRLTLTAYSDVRCSRSAYDSRCPHFGQRQVVTETILSFSNFKPIQKLGLGVPEDHSCWTKPL